MDVDVAVERKFVTERTIELISTAYPTQTTFVSMVSKFTEDVNKQNASLMESFILSL